ncbi:diguanylate cyclase (GGDEF)-like protein [Anaerotaenia torta]|uniref:GGDEF domain-containing protein n=1 Tax=Anaerotaenia torta TaxID=433293 RepID=UPI003D1A271D
MEFNEYDKHIQEQISQVLEVRIQRPEEVKQICKKLISIGEGEDDDKLLGFAYYYLAEAYFDCNQYDKFIQKLVQGLEYQLKVPLISLLSKSYNMLGINADNQGNIPAAIDYYLTSLKYCNEYGLDYEAGLVNGNIGQIYASLREYKTAIHYLDKALICFHKDKGNQNSSRGRMIAETTIARCYLQIGDKEASVQWFDLIQKEKEGLEGDGHYPIVILCFEILFFHKMEEYDKRDQRMEQMITVIEETSSLLDIYDETFTLCEVLRETGNYHDLWRVLKRVELLTGQAGIVNMQLKVLKHKLQYYKLIHNETDYMRACADYVILSEHLEAEKQANARNAIELRLDLEVIKEKHTVVQEENKVLLEKSQRDPLTRLPNRERLNEYTEIAFERAYRNQTSLGVEIFDIDCFKEYNDTFGHQAGDKCLKKMAKLLNALMEQGMFCARYGGDEFIIVYENKTDDEILEIAGKLKQDVIALKLCCGKDEKQPMITISQGIRNSVPKKGNKIWDYFYAADMSMYWVKRASKNDIRLVHTAYEVSTVKEGNKAVNEGGQPV